MAELVLGIGSSHSPMCSMSGADWLEWGQNDLGSGLLYTAAGEHVTYEQRLKAVGDTMLAKIEPAVCEAGGRRVEAALERLNVTIAAAKLDAVIVIGDDQDEHLLSGNLPPFLLYWGDSIPNTALDPESNRPPLVKRFLPGYLETDGNRQYPVAKELARHVIAQAFANDFDVATSDHLPVEGKAMGHAFGFAVRRLGCADIPLIPIMVNTYNPPAQPRAARCAAFGTMLRSAVDSFGVECRVGVVASGGLSHFLVLEDLDREVLAALERDDLDALTSIDEAVYVAGTSEIKNWITVAAMCRDRGFETVDYVPGYRTPAGTGTGLAFGIWQ